MERADHFSDPAMQRRSDADLALHALNGDDAAFTQLVSRHKGWALQYIRRYVRNSDDTYDLLQDTFFAAWLALARYQRDRPFNAWLRRIALNKCRDRARREAVRGVSSFLGSEDALEVADSAPGPAALIEGDQELRQLERDMQKLSRSLKQPLLLTAIEGLSHFEAGEVLGMSAKAVEMRVYRARARLQQLRAELCNRLPQSSRVAV